MPSPNELVAFSPEDIKYLKAFIAEQKSKRQNAPLQFAEGGRESPPAAMLFKVAAGLGVDLPGLDGFENGDIPGRRVCQGYRIYDDENFSNDPGIWPVEEFKAVVYNITPGAIADHRIFLAIRDIFGKWIAVNDNGVTIVRFEITSVHTAPRIYTAEILTWVYGSGNLGNGPIQVRDSTNQGCYFTDETAAELLGRQGYAVYMEDARDSGTANPDPHWEVMALCCAGSGTGTIG